jgi:hypothetical protein
LQFTLGFFFIAYFLNIFVLGINVMENGPSYTFTIVRGCAVDPLVVGLNSLVNLSFFLLFVQIYMRDNFSNEQARPKKVGSASSSPAALCVPAHAEAGKKKI